MEKCDYAIQYKPGEEMVLANCISCFPSNKESLPITIYQNIQHVQLFTNKLDAIRGAIEHDLVYSTLYCLTLRGWPNQLKEVPRITHHFWDAWAELSIKAGILLKADCICISPSSTTIPIPSLTTMAHTSRWKRCNPKPESHITGLVLMQIQSTMSRGAPYAPSIRLPNWPS